MNHPLSRIFVPIAMIIVVAASSVAVGTVETRARADSDDIALAVVTMSTDELQARAADKSWSDRR